MILKAPVILSAVKLAIIFVTLKVKLPNTPTAEAIEIVVPASKCPKIPIAITGYAIKDTSIPTAPPGVTTAKYTN